MQNDTTTMQTEVAKPKSVSSKTVKAAKKAISVEWKKVGSVKGIKSNKIVNGKKVYSSW